jgi:peptide/nickel transport system substrate-binding protein
VETLRLIIKSKTAYIAALLLLVALLCAGVQAAIAEEQTLTMRVSSWKDVGLDPTVSQTVSPDKGGITYNQHHFTHESPLIALDGEGRIIPWMAESYEVSDDCKTITFHIRKEVKFADGTPFNASVAKFNFDRIITHGWADKVGPKGTAAKRNSFIYYDSSEALDECTFEIHFTKGWLDAARDLAYSDYFFSYFISPFDVEPAWDINGTLKPDKKYNGLGPYYVDENETVPKEKLVLKKRHCWRDDLDFHRAKLDKIVEVVIPSSETSVLAMEKGEIDYMSMSGLSPESLAPLENNPKVRIEKRADSGLFYIYTAYWNEPFNGTDGVLLRKAICYALNRSDIAVVAFDGYAVPAINSIFLSPLYLDLPKCSLKGYDYDPEKAKQLLSEAGWKDTDGDGILDKNGRSLKDLDLLLNSEESPAWTDIATMMQSQLKKMGIDVKIRSMETSAYNKEAKEGKFELTKGVSASIGMSLVTLMTCFDVRAPGYRNVYSNHNNTLEEYVEKARTTTSIVERDQDICRACDILYDEAGIIPLVYPMKFAVMNSKVNGFEFGAATERDHIEECWIEE